MELDSADPSEVPIADVNERSEARMISGLQGNVAERGVLQPPLVRPDGDGGLECVAGGRRVLAADRAHLDEIPVLVVEWSDAEALAASISENGEMFREKVSAQDRAQALSRLWDLLGGEGRPVAAPLADRLGAPRQTVDQWIEPLRTEWEGTDVAPGSADADTDATGSSDNSTTTAVRQRESDGEHESGERGVDDKQPTPNGCHRVTGERHESSEAGAGESGIGVGEPIDVDEVGERNLREIRLATGGGEAGVELAHEVADGNLGREELREIKGRVRRGEGLSEAVTAVADDGVAVSLDGGALMAATDTDHERASESRDSMTVEVAFEGEAADALEGAALATDREPVGIVEEGTVTYLDAKGWFQ